MTSDEKVCPYCAEVIKAAAIRCRYCQSDLEPAPPSAPAPAPAQAPAPPAPPERGSEPEPTSEPKTPRPALLSGSRPSRLTGILAGAVVGLLILTVVVVMTRGRAPAVPTQGQDAPAVLLDERSARDAALQAATQLAQQVLSYKWNTLEADIAAARKGMTPAFEKQYLEALDSVKEQTRENQIVLTATVVAAGLVSATDTRAQALLFTNQSTVAKDSDAPRIDQNRVLVTMTRNGGDWRVSKMDAF